MLSHKLTAGVTMWTRWQLAQGRPDEVSTPVLFRSRCSVRDLCSLFQDSHVMLLICTICLWHLWVVPLFVLPFLQFFLIDVPIQLSPFSHHHFPSAPPTATSHLQSHFPLAYPNRFSNFKWRSDLSMQELFFFKSKNKWWYLEFVRLGSSDELGVQCAFHWFFSIFWATSLGKRGLGKGLNKAGHSLAYTEYYFIFKIKQKEKRNIIVVTLNILCLDSNENQI